MSHRSSVLTLCLCLALATPAAGQKPAGQPTAAELIRTLQDREFTEAVGAADRLGGFASQRAQVVPALIDALRNREWATCSGDVRDAIARSLAQLKAKEAVVPLLELVKSGMLGAINELADFSHSKAIADLISDNNKAKDRLILTLGRIGPPRYANFIGRWREDSEPEVRRSVASALGLIDNPSITIPVLVQLLARGKGSEASGVKWEASESLVKVGKRPGGDAVRPRLAGLLGEPDGLTVALAARALAALGDARGVTKLRELTTHAESGTRQEAVLALGTLPDKGGADA